MGGAAVSPTAPAGETIAIQQGQHMVMTRMPESSGSDSTVDQTQSLVCKFWKHLSCGEGTDTAEVLEEIPPTTGFTFDFLERGDTDEDEGESIVSPLGSAWLLPHQVKLHHFDKATDCGGVIGGAKSETRRDPFCMEGQMTAGSGGKLKGCCRQS